MPLVEVLPILAILSIAIYLLALATGRLPAALSGWRVPAVLSGAFLAWSLFAVLTEGPTGFWTEHVRNRWGNQIFFDLLLGIGVAMSFLVPEARCVGVRPLPWTLLTLATGCIGLLAFLARVIYVRDQSKA